MLRYFTTGLILAAILAMNAIGVSAAQAGSLDAGAVPAILTGTQGSTLSTKAKLVVTSVSGVTLSTVKCTTASLTATTFTTSVNEAVLTPSYGVGASCELGGFAATVSPGTCKYTLSGVETAASIANASITGCTSTLAIVQGSCTLSVASTSVALAQVKFTNTSELTPDHMTADLEFTKIPISGSAGCPANLVGSTNTADLSGSYTFKAFTYEGCVEGAQVNLTTT
jgi:hypothetical protein